MSRKLTQTLLCLLPLASQVLSWKGEGHLLVARIAYERLQAEKSTALKNANTLLSVVTKETPDVVAAEQDYPFVESATFADLIKYKGGGWQSDWHFVDIPFLDEGGSVDQFPDFKFTDKNITAAIEGIVAWLQEEDGYKEHFVYTTMMPKMKDEKYGQSYALRLLIHYIGDVHQPLHCLARVDATYPAGDRGGNSFNLPNHYEANNLHSVWDSILYEFHKNDKIPYDEATWESLGTHVQQLMADNTVKASDYENLNFLDWADQSFQLGSLNAYAGIKEGDKLPDDYIAKNNKITERQIVLGGYRLAYLIDQLFGSSKRAETIVENAAAPALFLQ